FEDSSHPTNRRRRRHPDIPAARPGGLTARHGGTRTTTRIPEFREGTVMRVRSVLLLSAFTAGLAFLTGCGSSGTANNTGTTPRRPQRPGHNTNARAGGARQRAAPPVNVERPPAGARESIVVANSTVQYEERQQVAAAVDGVIEFLATPMPEGTAFDPTQDMY